jgi:hypothetical protein
MWQEVIEIDVVALEGVVDIARDSGNEAVLTWGVVKLRVLGAVHGPRGHLGVPLSLRELLALCID